jgi:hypothetical protein
MKIKYIDAIDFLNHYLPKGFSYYEQKIAVMQNFRIMIKYDEKSYELGQFGKHYEISGKNPIRNILKYF